MKLSITREYLVDPDGQTVSILEQQVVRGLPEDDPVRQTVEGVVYDFHNRLSEASSHDVAEICSSVVDRIFEVCRVRNI